MKLRPLFLVGAMMMTQQVLASAKLILPENYQTFSATNKLDVLWDEVISSEHKVNPPLSVDPSMIMLKIFGFVEKTAITGQDEMPLMRNAFGFVVRRPKLIHAKGSVAQVRWVPTEANTKYSGVLGGGGEGVLRLSVAGPSSALGFLPGAAIKILRDGQSSLNLVFMPGLDGQEGDCHFFQQEYRSALTQPKSKFLDFALSQFKAVASKYMGPGNTGLTLPIGHLAKNSSNHLATIPFKLSFTPTQSAKQSIGGSCEVDFRSELAKINPGTPLFVIRAHSSMDDQGEVIGYLEATTRFVASEFGDKVLFFQHHLQ